MDNNEDERKTHPYTDHMLDSALSALSGSDVRLTGTKSDGTTFRHRPLTNVSFVPRSGSVFVIGMDPEAKAVRQFDLNRIEAIETDLLRMDRQAVLASLENASRKLQESSIHSERDSK